MKRNADIAKVRCILSAHRRFWTDDYWLGPEAMLSYPAEVQLMNNDGHLRLHFCTFAGPLSLLYVNYAYRTLVLCPVSPLGKALSFTTPSH